MEYIYLDKNTMNKIIKKGYFLIENKKYNIFEFNKKEAKKILYEQLISKYNIEKILNNRLPNKWGPYTLKYFEDIIIKNNRIFKKYKLKEKLKMDKETEKYYFIYENNKYKLLIPKYYIYLKNNKIKIKRKKLFEKDFNI